MLKNLNELTPYERELLRTVVVIREREKPEVGIADRELRIPPPPPPKYN